MSIGHHLLKADLVFSFCSICALFGMGKVTYAQTQRMADSIMVRPKAGIYPEDIQLTGDTLYVSIHADSLVFPFGRQDDFQIIRGRFPQLTVTKRVIDCDNDSAYKVSTYQLSSENSFVKFYKEDEEDGGRYDLFYGKVVDNTLVVWKGIEIGMAEKEFLLKFLQESTPKILSQIRVVELDTSPNGAYIYFVFDNQQLGAIYFKTGFLAKDIDLKY